MKTTPHKTRQSTIKYFMLLATMAIIVAHCTSCSPKTGCPAVSGKYYKSGY